MMTTNSPVKSTDVRPRSPWGELGPWGDFMSLTTPMQELLKQMWPSWTTADFSPGGELHESDEAFVLELDLPGVDKKDVSIEISERRLRIQGTKTVKEKTGVLRHSTRTAGTFAYELVLPESVQEGSATATLVDGVLTVTMPKTGEMKTTHVDIT